MDQMLVEPETDVPGGHLDAGHIVFGFEADFASDLRCIPMLVRFKLDRIGIKLSLKQWTKIGPDNRRLLALLPCNTYWDVADYRRTLTGLVKQHTPEPIVDLKLDLAPCWADSELVADPVVQQACLQSVAAPTPNQWAGLSTLQRFALVKLARSKHDNENFIPAMREFGLLNVA